ncbi:Peptidase family M23 [Roseovarius tolerans]|uniref:Peptidase family M23 n=1 Tax=Roseovarius tolerans TaxID=74031 RepID=A0A1H8CN04_9RHOB|nr:M23 family metallopeptidase [Roseovarius tolerans]SEM96302.1 Peptidase family M23 [Roseovarius tolerans]
MRRAYALASILTLAAAQTAAADAFRLALPLDCTLGQTCYIEDYVDTDPGPGQRDYMCGLNSRDDHRGTDFMLPSFEAMQTGVDVLAAAPGTVAATRDDMADTTVTAATREAIRGRECGNAVRVDHGDGWQTLYCHLKLGSIQVRKGEEVMTGDVLGEVGLSGLTNAPHVHLGVLKDGEIVDPFHPDNITQCGEATDGGLWQTPLAYTRAGLFTAGFSTAVPSFEAVQSGAARMGATAGDQPLVLYGHVFYAQPGDQLILTAHGPEGEVFRHEITLDAPKVQLFRAFGRKAPAAGWRAGAYRGYVRLIRGDTLIAARHADITVTP